MVKMTKENDFKSITIPFSKKNDDVKEKLKDLTELTGKSKVDLICEAIRKYQPDSKANDSINKKEIEDIVEKRVKEILGGMLLNNLSLNINPVNIQPFIDHVKQEKSKEEVEKERLQELNNKKINMSLLDDDD